MSSFPARPPCSFAKSLRSTPLARISHTHSLTLLCPPFYAAAASHAAQAPKYAAARAALAEQWARAIEKRGVVTLPLQQRRAQEAAAARSAAFAIAKKEAWAAVLAQRAAAEGAH